MNPPVRSIPELLAPAGSPEAFRAAIAAGADAIYLSGKRFGARKYAANFSDAEIVDAVRLAHTRGVRVYVTVNTLIHDRELPAALEYLIWLYTIGVDAVLVQDLGLLALARKMIPGLVLHASTQMTIHNAAGVRWAAEHGLSRVVLARELSLAEVSAIAEATQDTGVGLEVFAHGALCYGYSGQCLLSSFIGGRSGNRGMCAQPCRKPWTLVTGTTDEYGRPARIQDAGISSRYLLSPKDLCTYRHLKELVASPFVSLKIEGRMKSADYVAVVVATYRTALDAIAAGTWEPSAAAEQDLLLAFNREFTGGYLFSDRHDRLMGRDAPDNRGLRIGTVTRTDRKSGEVVVQRESSYMPETGDGLLMVHPGSSAETGFSLNTPPRTAKDGLYIRTPHPVPAGSAVFVTASRELAARARQIVAKSGPGYGRLLPVDLEATISGTGELTLNGSVERPDGVVVPVSCSSDIMLEPARSRPLAREVLAAQLEKSGGTPFYVRTLSLSYDGTRFAPLGEINRLRREFFDAATERLVASYCPPENEIQRITHRWQDEAPRYPVRTLNQGTLAGPKPLRITLCVDTPEGVREAVAAGVDTVCFEPDSARPPAACGGETSFASPLPALSDALATCEAHGVELVWKFPRITHDRSLRDLTSYLQSLAQQGLAGCMVDTFGAARAVRDAAPGIPVHGFLGLNIFNHAAVSAAGDLFSSVTLSSELSRDDIALLVSNMASRKIHLPCNLVVQGVAEALVSADCICRLHTPCNRVTVEAGREREFLGIRDEEGRVYPVRGSGSCTTQIGNCAELSLIEYLPLIRSLGIAGITIDARHRSPSYIRAICRIYRNAAADLASRQANGRRAHGMPSWKKEIEAIASGPVTTGHFLRGLRE
ncbi:MAG: U32 family peptidase [Methanomicrobiales archaeon]|nr:U32 family peptidase [Methanomicrobiales archaeon]